MIKTKSGIARFFAGSTSEVNSDGRSVKHRIFGMAGSQTGYRARSLWKNTFGRGHQIHPYQSAAGGKFDLHQDKYGHFFYFLNGQGKVRVGSKQIEVVPGLIVRLNAGELHAYENTGNQDLTLISVNIPAR